MNKPPLLSALILILTMLGCDAPHRTAVVPAETQQRISEAKEFCAISDKIFGKLVYYSSKISYGTAVQQDGSLVVMPPDGGALSDENKLLFNLPPDCYEGGAVWRVHLNREGDGWRLRFSEAGAVKSKKRGGPSYEPHWPYWEAARRIYLEKLRAGGMVLYVDEASDAEKAKDPVQGYLQLSLSMLALPPP